MKYLLFAFLFFAPVLHGISKGAEVGKVFQINGRAIEITGEKARTLKSGTRILIETPSGLFESTIKEQFHTKAKTTVSHYQAGKISAGAKVYLIGKEVRKPDKATEELIKLCNWALPEQPTEAEVQEVIDQGADVNFHTEDDRKLRTHKGMTPLLMAASRSRELAVKVLIQNGADINARNPRDESTALIIGAKNPAIVRLLLEKGADASQVDKDHDSALFSFVRFNSGGFKAHKPDDAHTKMKIELTGLLLQAGADINHANEEGRTVLMEAASQGNPYFVKYLIEKGADMKAKNKDGETVLAMMERMVKSDLNYQGHSNWEKVIEVLRELGAPK